MTSNLRRYSTMKFPILATAVPTILTEPLIFVCDCYSYRVLQFVYAIFYLFFFNAARASRILCPRAQRCHIGTAVIDTAVSVTLVPFALMCIWAFDQSLHSLIRGVGHSGVNDTAVLLYFWTSLHSWIRGVSHSGVIDTDVPPTLSNNFANSKPYSKRS
jgi:hypothetical protein